MNTFFDYLHYMAEGGAPQQQMAPQQQSGNQQDQIMQIIQMYAQITQADPREILQQLQKMQPEDQQKALQQMVQVVQQAAQQQQGGQGQEEQMQEQPPMRYGGGYSGTYDAATGSYFAGGGSYLPDYGMAYGGAYSEIPGLFSRDADSERRFMHGGIPHARNGMIYTQQNKDGSTSPLDSTVAAAHIANYIDEQRQALHSNPFTRSQMKRPYGFNPYDMQGMPQSFGRPNSYYKEDGGIVVGQEIDASPELMQKLKEGGYTFEYID